MNIDFSQVDLNINNIGNWPLPIKIVVVLVICVAVLGAGYYFDTQNKVLELDGVKNIEVGLRKDFETKQAKAASLDAYKQQMVEMEESFGTMLRQLPSKTEVADLLVDITQAGLASGLEFQLFEPDKEIPQEFYAELPINIEVLGTYHEFGEFVSSVAALPRIVTLHDVDITKDSKSGKLTMKVVAKTYRYLDETEVRERSKAAKKSSRKR